MLTLLRELVHPPEAHCVTAGAVLGLVLEADGAARSERNLMITASQLSKRYGKHVVVADMS